MSEQSEQVHDHAQLGAYVLGVLDPDEVRAVDRHLAGCPDCRREFADLTAMRDLLGEVPPEAFLDGPPDSDLLLQRTLREVRADRARSGRFRVTLVAAGVVAFAAATMGVGVLVGRQTAPVVGAAPPPPATSAPATSPSGSPVSPPASVVPSGVRTLTGTDPTTGATMTVALTPAAGWVRVHATVGGIPAGKECVLQVVPKGGTPVTAGSWLVSPKGAKEGTSLDGSAIVPVDKIAAVQVITVQGQKLITVAA